MEMKVHTSENFYSLNRNFGFQPKIGGISEMKINRDLFCISLNLHYLWLSAEGTHARKFSNKFGILLTYSYLCSGFEGIRCYYII